VCRVQIDLYSQTDTHLLTVALVYVPKTPSFSQKLDESNKIAKIFPLCS
jgi:hypothetical protein